MNAKRAKSLRKLVRNLEKTSEKPIPVHQFEYANKTQAHFDLLPSQLRSLEPDVKHKIDRQITPRQILKQLLEPWGDYPAIAEVTLTEKQAKNLEAKKAEAKAHLEKVKGGINFQGQAYNTANSLRAVYQRLKKEMNQVATTK